MNLLMLFQQKADGYAPEEVDTQEEKLLVLREPYSTL